LRQYREKNITLLNDFLQFKSEDGTFEIPEGKPLIEEKSKANSFLFDLRFVVELSQRIVYRFSASEIPKETAEE